MRAHTHSQMDAHLHIRIQFSFSLSLVSSSGCLPYHPLSPPTLPTVPPYLAPTPCMLTEPVDAEGFNQGGTMRTGRCGGDRFPSELHYSLCSSVWLRLQPSELLAEFWASFHPLTARYDQDQGIRINSNK